MLHASLLYQNVGEEEEEANALLLTANGQHGDNGMLARIHVAPRVPKKEPVTLQLEHRAVVLLAPVPIQNPDHAIQECKAMF